MPVQYAKMNKKYINNPQLHLRDLVKHRDMLREMILGTDGDWREEIEFIIIRTNEAIKEITDKMMAKHEV